MAFFRKLLNVQLKDLKSPQYLKTQGLKLEKRLLNITLGKLTALLVVANGGWYFYTQKNTDDTNQQIYWSTTRWMSRNAGYMAEKTIPIQWRNTLFGMFAKSYDVIVEDMVEPDFEKYENFLQFFTRSVKPRTYSQDESQLITPADSRVLSFTEITKDSVVLVKDIKYSVGQLMTGNPNYQVQGELLHDMKKSKNERAKLYSIIFYLAPGDYHRFHSPTDISLKARCHILGHLAPVKISHISKTPVFHIVKHKGVYESNERVSIFGEYKYGFMSMIFVGALNVGSILLHFDDKVQTNTKLLERPSQLGKVRAYTLIEQDKMQTWVERGLDIQKGAELGMFKLGSTIVMVFEAETVEWLVQPGQQVRWGESFAIIKDNTEQIK